MPDEIDPEYEAWKASPDGLAAARLALGKKLRAKRKERGETQAQVADAVGIDRSLYSRWEKGERSPDYQQWRRLAIHFGVKMMDLMPRNQYPGMPIDPVERNEAMAERNRRIAAGALRDRDSE